MLGRKSSLKKSNLNEKIIGGRKKHVSFGNGVPSRSKNLSISIKSRQRKQPDQIDNLTQRLDNLVLENWELMDHKITAEKETRLVGVCRQQFWDVWRDFYSHILDAFKNDDVLLELEDLDNERDQFEHVFHGESPPILHESLQSDAHDSCLSVDMAQFIVFDYIDIETMFNTVRDSVPEAEQGNLTGDSDQLNTSLSGISPEEDILDPYNAPVELSGIEQDIESTTSHQDENNRQEPSEEPSQMLCKIGQNQKQIDDINTPIVADVGENSINFQECLSSQSAISIANADSSVDDEFVQSVLID